MELKRPFERLRSDQSLKDGFTLAFSVIAVFSAFVIYGVVTLWAEGKHIPNFRVGMWFFLCTGLSSIAGIFWVRRITKTDPDSENGLMIKNEIVKVKTYNDVNLYHAEQCLTYCGVTTQLEMKQALKGLITGTHVFFLKDGTYLTEAGVLETVGKCELRSAINFMREFNVVLNNRNDFKDPAHWEQS